MRKNAYSSDRKCECSQAATARNLKSKTNGKWRGANSKDDGIHDPFSRLLSSRARYELRNVIDMHGNSQVGDNARARAQDTVKRMLLVLEPAGHHVPAPACLFGILIRCASIILACLSSVPNHSDTFTTVE